MADGDFIALRCAAETLVELSTFLTRFGPTDGPPNWLISGVWLCCGEAHYLATSSAEVLPSGVMVRPLHIQSTRTFIEQLESELPDVSTRLKARDVAIDLPAAGPAPVPPSSLERWPQERYSMDVLVRVTRRNSRLERVACALLFKGQRGRLLVGTDTSQMAMVLSLDAELIDRYLVGCETFSLEDYLERAKS